MVGQDDDSHNASVRANYQKMTPLELANMERAMLSIANLTRRFMKFEDDPREVRKLEAKLRGAQATLLLIHEVMAKKATKKRRGGL